VCGHNVHVLVRKELFGSTLYLVSFDSDLLGICFAYTAIPDTGERLSRKRKRSERDALVESGCENLTDSAVAGGEVTPLATFHREVNVQQQY
jgi:hypothetical protein